jgi:DNA replication initiation complex subunit (GINS family)
LAEKWQILFKRWKKMEQDEINYKTLRKIQQSEKNSPILTELKSNFYFELSDYLENLNKRLENESSSQKQVLLKEEIKNTLNIATNIYEQREKKILLAAISKARGGNPDIKNMADVEKDLFENILDNMNKLRKKILKIKSNEINKNDAKPIEKREDEKSNQNNDNKNPIIMITKNIPEFIGTDEKKYNLRKNDIISLPEDMSEMLSKRGVADKISK